MRIKGTTETISGILDVVSQNKNEPIEIGFRSGEKQHVIKCLITKNSVVHISDYPNHSSIHMDLIELINIDTNKS